MANKVLYVAAHGSQVASRRNGSSRPAKSMNMSVNRPSPSRLGDDFDSFASTLRRAMGPLSTLENILTDRLILAAWRLQLASSVDFEMAGSGETLPPISQETLDVEASLEKSLTLLERSRADRLGRDSADADTDAFDLDETLPPSRPLFLDPLDDANFSNEWTTLPDERLFPEVSDDDDDYADDDFQDDEDSVDAPRWQDRLVFDFNVSEVSPVVKGTWITVGHVVSMIVDGFTWNDVLRTHPELTEDDIRTCLAYTLAQDDRGF